MKDLGIKELYVMPAGKGFISPNGGYVHLGDDLTDCTFDLVVFDPPHLIRAGKTSWLAKKYGTLDLMGWPHELHQAFQEIMRVLKPTGVLLFKWNEDQIPAKEVFKAFGYQPILGDMEVKPFAYIATGIDGEHWAIDKDVFEHTYERVE